MADNVTADPGSGGAVFATDDDGTAHHPYTKVEWGADGTRTPVDTGAAGLPIQDGGNSITVDGTVAVTNSGLTELAAAINGSSQMDVNIAASAATVAVSNAGLTELAGAINASAQMDVNIAASSATITVASHAVTNAGTFATQVDGAALTALQLIDNPVLVDDAAFTPGASSVSMAGFEADESSTDSIDEGDAGAARMTLDRKQIVSSYAHTTGGWTPHSHLSDGTNQDSEIVKSTAGQLGMVYATNVNAAAAYVKFYNTSISAEETDTPVLRFLIPGNTAGAGGTVNFNPGIVFDVGICYRITTAVADASSAGAAANEVVLNLGYK